MKRLQLLEMKTDALQFMTVHTRPGAVMNYNVLCDSPGPDGALCLRHSETYRCLLKILENF